MPHACSSTWATFGSLGYIWLHLAGIGIAATAHLAATAPHCRFIEFLPATLTSSPLRQRLTCDDEVLVTAYCLLLTAYCLLLTADC